MLLEDNDENLMQIVIEECEEQEHGYKLTLEDPQHVLNVTTFSDYCASDSDSDFEESICWISTKLSWLT